MSRKTRHKRRLFHERETQPGVRTLNYNVMRKMGIVLLVVSLLLVILDQAQFPFVHKSRLMLFDLMSSFVKVSSDVEDAASDALQDVSYAFNVNQNRLKMDELISENSALKSRLEKLTIENKQLLALHQMQSDFPYEYITAKIIGRPSQNFSHTLLINAGHKQGVKEGSVVVDEVGLIGRIVEVAMKTSRILLLTDYNSRVPIVMEKTRLTAIVQGRGSDTPVLAFLDPMQQVEIGERAITSGDGGIFPAGIIVGRILEKADPQHGNSINPAASLDKLRYVRVILNE